MPFFHKGRRQLGSPAIKMEAESFEGCTEKGFPRVFGRYTTWPVMLNPTNAVGPGSWLELSSPAY